ncbi:MAG: ribosomal protein S18-alanine N-acetyltransferase [Oscillospiraceae bacterium]
MSFEIRPADTGMLTEIAALETECFSTPWSEKSFAAELDNTDSIFLTALRGAKLLGFVIVRKFSGEAEILNIAVRKAERGLEIGSKLLRCAIEAAERDDVKTIFLEVRESNVPAITLYAKNGFTVIGRRKKYYEAPAEDAILMSRAKLKVETGDK